MHRLTSTLKLPITIDVAWEFFSNPSNLALITPRELCLVPRTELPSEMYPGIFIEYFVRPLFNIPIRWVTEITQIRHKEYFVDEQRLGPYQIWHHQHHFKEVPGGVEMVDIIDYRLPFGFLGLILQRLFIGRKVEQIFEYRTKVLEQRFGVYNP
jgi:ligand-binding SRPBCC domain-containing protein